MICDLLKIFRSPKWHNHILVLHFIVNKVNITFIVSCILFCGVVIAVLEIYRLGEGKRKFEIFVGG